MRLLAGLVVAAALLSTEAAAQNPTGAPAQTSAPTDLTTPAAPSPDLSAALEEFTSPPAAPADTIAVSRRDIVLAALRRHQRGSDRLYAAPEFPPNIERGAREAARLRPEEELLGVGDNSFARNGRVGLYFLADRIVIRGPLPLAAAPVYYNQLRGVEPRHGTFALHYGDIVLDTTQLGKARIAALIEEILRGLEGEPQS
jgi:hypothetical protein